MPFHLHDLALFTRVAELGSLSAAARERDVPVSQVSRTLRRLEAASGVRLLHRSTHGQSLTDEGDTFLAYCRRLLDTSTELASELGGKVAGPSGWVRVSVSPVVAEMLIGPSLNGLYERHPQVQLDISADDRMADMAREGIDIAIRTGQLSSDTLVARRIGDFGRVLVGTPAYLARHGTPQTLADLDAHRLIANSTNPALARWPLPDGATYQARGHTRTDNSAMVMHLARQGVGLARVMDLLAAPLIRSGELVPLLQAALEGPRVPIYAVMLQERQRLPKIRACIDYWAEWLATAAIPPLHNPPMPPPPTDVTDAAPWPTPRRADSRFMFAHPAHAIALGFGSGLSPVAPGTAGTLWAWLAFLVAQALWQPTDLQWGLAILATVLAGWWAGAVTARHMGVQDPGQIVIDEIAAFWLVLWLAMPTGFWGQLGAFALFRFFDAAKPGPVAWADQLFKGFGWRGGWGILFDDLVAAFCTLLVIALWRFW